MNSHHISSAAPSHIVENERSWGIQLISAGNQMITAGGFPLLGRLAGEHGLRAQHGPGTLFPDVYVYDHDGRVVMGWELKFPDTAITDGPTFVNAAEKARRLRTTAFLLWNVSQAVLYHRPAPLEDDEPVAEGWTEAGSWSLGASAERGRVFTHEAAWTAMLEEILGAIVEYMETGGIRPRTDTLTVGVEHYTGALAQTESAQRDALATRARRDRVFGLRVERWKADSGDYRGRDVLEDLARVTVIGWMNKLLFLHQLRGAGVKAGHIITRLDTASAVEFVQEFETFTRRADFASIFSASLGQDVLSEPLVQYLRSFNAYLRDHTADGRGDFDFGDSLRLGLQQIRSKAAGQFPTPPALARLLVGLTVTDADAVVIDPCCGTGTIARAVADRKTADGVGPAEVARTVWSSDRYDAPLGFAGIALADRRAVNEIQHVFREDVARLRPGLEITFRDPHDGTSVTEALPTFGAVVSNLPFVRFEDIAAQDRDAMHDFAGGEDRLSGKSDLYAFITLGLDRLVAPEGRVGLILSASWLNTEWGRPFRQVLRERFHLDVVLTSAAGRWFDNADVATSLVVLRPRQAGESLGPTFVGETARPVAEWTEDIVDDMTARILLALADGRGHVTSNALVGDVVAPDALQRLDSIGTVLTHAAGGADVLQQIADSTVPVRDVARVFRGMRPGFEKFWFVSAAGATQIEDEHLIPLLHRPGQSLPGTALAAVEPRHFAFFCTATEEELLERGHGGALQHIHRHAATLLGRGAGAERADEKFASADRPWYTLKNPPRRAAFVLQLNPDRVFAVYRPASGEEIAFSQRLVGLHPQTADRELFHAALTSSPSLMWHEVIGAPRGLGVLDRSSQAVSSSLRVPDPARLEASGRRPDILAAFARVRDRVPLPLVEELEMEDRHELDRVILDAMGLSWMNLDDLYRPLRLAHHTRLSFGRR